MNIRNTLLSPVRTATSWINGELRCQRTQREWWSYLGSFGDDFFDDED